MCQTVDKISVKDTFMKLRCADWKHASSRIWTLLLVIAAIVALASVAAAGELEPGVRGVAQDDSIVVAQDEGNTTHATGRCKPSGCGHEICSDENMATPCIWRAEFACYKKAVCEEQTDGKCGWTMTAELAACLKNSQGSLSGDGDRGEASPTN
jgi:hypothetical protein